MVTSNSDKDDLKHADLIIAREAGKDATVGQRLEGWARGSLRGGLVWDVGQSREGSACTGA